MSTLGEGGMFSLGGYREYIRDVQYIGVFNINQLAPPHES